MKQFLDKNNLNVTKVNVGDEHPLQIVCGAPNVATGMKVIVAKTGAVLPRDFQIKQTTLMDIESHGMICSLEELGIKEDVIPKYAEEGSLVYRMSWKWECQSHLI